MTKDDWRYGCKTINDIWSRARTRGMLSDVHFLVGQQDGQRRFEAHRIVLAFGSPVFEAMFFGNFSQPENPVVIPDDDPEAFEMLLRHLYGEKATFSTVSVACKTCSLADKYILPTLQTTVAKYISSVTMNDQIFWTIIESKLFFNPAVENQCREYIARNATSLLKSESILTITEDIADFIVKMEEINVEEFDLLMAITSWGLHKFRSEINVNDKLMQFLRHIRFKNLSANQFCKFTDSFPGVIDPQSSFEIMKSAMNSDYKLPPWCSVSGPRGRYKTSKTTLTLNRPSNSYTALTPQQAHFLSSQKFDRYSNSYPRLTATQVCFLNVLNDMSNENL